jgi:hypothetical protein
VSAQAINLPPALSLTREDVARVGDALRAHLANAQHLNAAAEGGV